MQRKWKWVFVASILVCLVLFIGVTLTETVKVPSEGWSRNVILDQFVDKSDFESWKYRYLGVQTDFASKEHYVLSSDTKTGFNMKVISFDGKCVQNKMIEGLPKEVDRFFLEKKNNQFLIQVLSNGKISTYTLGENYQILSKTQLPLVDVKDFESKSGMIVYRSSTAFGLVKEGLNREINKTADAITFLSDDGSKVAVIEEVNGLKKLAVYNLKLSEPLVSQISLGNDAMISYEYLSAFDSLEGMGVILEVQDTKNAVNAVMYYGLNDDGSFKEGKEIVNGNWAFKPVIYEDDNHVNVLMSLTQLKGNQKILNVGEISIERLNETNGKSILEQAKFYTRTDEISIPFSFKEDGQLKFLFSIEQTSRGDTLVYSGTDEKLISKSGMLTGADFKKAGSALMFNILPTLLAGLIPIMNIFVPVFVALVLFSFFSLEKMEWHYKKAVWCAIVTHIVIKFFFTFKAILMNDQFANAGSVMPFYLNSVVAITITLIISTGLALWIAKLRSPEMIKGDCFGYYGAFAFIDLSVFIFLVMPYYYSYLAVPIFYLN